jgi:hypothetical protein
LRSRRRFWRYRGRRESLSSFALPDSFSTVPRASGLVFMFCAPGQYFGRYRGCQVLLSCFALADSFWAVPRAPVAVFMFCAPDTFLAVPRASSPVFMFCAPGLFLGVTEGFGSRFHVLRSRTHYGRYRFQVLRYLTRFRQYRGRRGPFSGFALPNSFLTLPRPSRLDLRFCATGLFLGVSEGAGF